MATVAKPQVNSRVKAMIAGLRGRATRTKEGVTYAKPTPPMDPERRIAAYQKQNGTSKLTAKQERRVRKARNKS